MSKLVKKSLYCRKSIWSVLCEMRKLIETKITTPKPTKQHKSDFQTILILRIKFKIRTSLLKGLSLKYISQSSQYLSH